MTKAEIRRDRREVGNTDDGDRRPYKLVCVCGEVGGDISRREEVSERDWGGGNWFNLVAQLDSF